MKSTGTTYLLWCACFFGGFGIHRFYLGRYGTGFLYLFTFGLFGIGQAIDLFQMGRLVEDENNRILVRGLGVQALAAGGLPALPGRRAPRTTEELQVSLAQAADQHGGRLTVAEAV